MPFSIETKREQLSFLDIEILREQGKITTTMYQKPAFNGI